MGAVGAGGRGEARSRVSGVDDDLECEGHQAVVDEECEDAAPPRGHLVVVAGQRREVRLGREVHGGLHLHAEPSGVRGGEDKRPVLRQQPRQQQRRAHHQQEARNGGCGGGGRGVIRRRRGRGRGGGPLRGGAHDGEQCFIRASAREQSGQR